MSKDSFNGPELCFDSNKRKWDITEHPGFHLCLLLWWDLTCIFDLLVLHTSINVQLQSWRGLKKTQPGADRWHIVLWEREEQGAQKTVLNVETRPLVAAWDNRHKSKITLCWYRVQPCQLNILTSWHVWAHFSSHHLDLAFPSLPVTRWWGGE